MSHSNLYLRRELFVYNLYCLQVLNCIAQALQTKQQHKLVPLWIGDLIKLSRHEYHPEFAHDIPRIRINAIIRD